MSKKLKLNQPIPENIVRMSRIRFGPDGEFYFSKVKLKSNKNKSTPYNNNDEHNEVNLSKPSTTSPPTAPIHHLDILTLIIPFLCLVSVTLIIFLVNLFRTSLMSSNPSGPSYRYRKSNDVFTPDIHTITPANSGDIMDTIGDGDGQNVFGKKDFVYLTPF
jgi:hypothetical protein